MLEQFHKLSTLFVTNFCYFIIEAYAYVYKYAEYIIILVIRGLQSRNLPQSMRYSRLKCQSEWKMIFVSYLFLFLVYKHSPLVASTHDHYRSEKLNCTRFLPHDLLEELRLELQPSNDSTSSPFQRKSRPRVLPEQYLLKCLKDAPYDRDVSAGAGMAYFTLHFVFSLCEVLELRFDGTLRLWTQLQISWEERRLAWQLNSGSDLDENTSTSNNVDVDEEYADSGNEEMKPEPLPIAAVNTTNGTRSTDILDKPLAFWPKMILYPSELLWSPLIRVLNCHTSYDLCYVRPIDNSSALLMASGAVTIRVPKLLEFTCKVDLCAPIFN